MSSYKAAHSDQYYGQCSLTSFNNNLDDGKFMNDTKLG